MNRNLKVSEYILINSSPGKVWQALTNPGHIKLYLYGTECITDWEIGSPIIFQGEYEGHRYQDKGNVLKNIENKILSYNYWSAFSSLPDSPKNYAIVTYIIEAISDNQVKLTWSQEGFTNEEGRSHLESNLPTILLQIKTIAQEL